MGFLLTKKVHFNTQQVHSTSNKNETFLWSFYALISKSYFCICREQIYCYFQGHFSFEKRKENERKLYFEPLETYFLCSWLVCACFFFC